MEKVLSYKDSRNDKSLINFGNSHSYSAIDNVKHINGDSGKGSKTKRCIQAFDTVTKKDIDSKTPQYSTNNILLKSLSI